MRKNQSYIFLVIILTLSFSAFSMWSWYERNEKSLPFYGNKQVAYEKEEINTKGIEPVGPFGFTNQDNATLGEAFVKDKIWVADFFFTRCGSICPIMSNNLVLVQNEFHENDLVKIISFTCDPENDHPGQLKDYANEYGARPLTWQFLTGEKPSLYSFARKKLQIVATDGDGSSGDFIHSQNLVLIDRSGYIRGYYDGTDEQQVKQLIIDIKKLM